MTSGPFEIEELPLKGLKLLHRQAFHDHRGCLERLFCADFFKSIGSVSNGLLSQINRSVTLKKGTVRGFHFQYPPHTETKIISCLEGCIFDVAIDLRADSPSYLNWHGEVLSAKNCNTLIIPEGFAHGFQTLSDHCALLYFHTAPYIQSSEGGINALDPTINVNWPHPIIDRSSRDKALPILTNGFKGL
jgi:dTDP-4-dehydrorhamnose 3,5-epimerase